MIPQTVEKSEWYQALVEDVRAIITESEFNSRWALVEGYHAVGERVVTDAMFESFAKGNKTFVQDLARNIGISERTLYYAIQFYKKFPDLALLPEGKNTSWNKVINQYLPSSNGHLQNLSISKIPYVHISDDSYEWFTPPEYIAAAREVMGEIDLDPASSDAAQESIKAKTYYTARQDGLSKRWFGRVWLNPPYNMPLIDLFIDRVVTEYEGNAVSAAIVLTNNSTDTGWFHKLIKFPFCLTRGRIPFWNGGDHLATRQGQALFYLGDTPDLFAAKFKQFGAVLKEYDHQQPD